MCGMRKQHTHTQTLHQTLSVHTRGFSALSDTLKFRSKKDTQNKVVMLDYGHATQKNPVVHTTPR